MKPMIKLALISLAIALSACSSIKRSSTETAENTPPTMATAEQLNSSTVLDASGQPVAVAAVATTGQAVGGDIERNMDNSDRIKMSRALDKAPGNSVHWTNMRTRASYTVTPIKKVVLNGNPYCRLYRISVTQGGQQGSVNGTACIGQSGGWEAVRE